MRDTGDNEGYRDTLRDTGIQGYRDTGIQLRVSISIGRAAPCIADRPSGGDGL
jgi:hypothetical protein